MDFRLADIADLPHINRMYRDLIEEMYRNGIEIWDDAYPFECFEEDIEKERLYVLFDVNRLVASFALSSSNIGAHAVEWESETKNVLYLDHLGVDVKYSGKGIGSLMIEQAKETARERGAEYLRLFVVDLNVPAVALYRKKGFSQAKGIFEEVIEKDLVFHEYGFEIKL